jgi:hypothetical protein
MKNVKATGGGGCLKSKVERGRKYIIKEMRTFFLLIAVCGCVSGFGYSLPSYTVTTNYAQYTNFWLTMSNAPSTPSVGIVNIGSTLPGLIYEILTNSNPATTNWGVWTNLVASGTNITAPAIDLSSQTRFFKVQLVLPESSYIANGLVAYWKLNDEDGTAAADSSGFNHTLYLSNSPSWGPGWLVMNGSDQYGDAGTSTADISYSDMTVCAWVNKYGYSEKGIVDKSFNIAGVGSGGWGFWVQDDGHVSFYGGGDGQSCVDNGGATIVPGQWEFVAVVWHEYSPAGGYEQQADFYYNGLISASVGNSAVGTTSSIGAADVQVGNLQDDLSNGAFAFDGSMHDVAIYNRALTANEVQSNFLSTEYTTNVSVPELLYYKMTSGSANTVTPQTLRACLKTPEIPL